jgi:hypothetical protein
MFPIVNQETCTVCKVVLLIDCVSVLGAVNYFRIFKGRFLGPGKTVFLSVKPEILNFCANIECAEILLQHNYYYVQEAETGTCRKLAVYPRCNMDIQKT